MAYELDLEEQIEASIVISNSTNYLTARARFNAISRSDYTPKLLDHLKSHINFEGPSGFVVHDTLRCLKSCGASVLPYLTAVKNDVDVSDPGQQRVVDGLDKIIRKYAP